MLLGKGDVCIDGYVDDGKELREGNLKTGPPRF